MPPDRFLLYSPLDTLPWKPGLAFAGYQTGMHWDTSEGYLKPLSCVATFAMRVIVLWFWLGLRRSRR